VTVTHSLALETVFCVDLQVNKCLRRLDIFSEPSTRTDQPRVIITMVTS